MRLHHEINLASFEITVSKNKYKKNELCSYLSVQLSRKSQTNRKRGRGTKKIGCLENNCLICLTHTVEANELRLNI